MALARARRQSSTRQRLGAARQARESQLGAFDTCLAFRLGRVATGESHGRALALAASRHQAHAARTQAGPGGDVAAGSETGGSGWLVVDAAARCSDHCGRPSASEQATAADGSRPSRGSHAVESAAGRASATTRSAPAALGGSRCAVCGRAETAWRAPRRNRPARAHRNHPRRATARAREARCPTTR